MDIELKEDLTEIIQENEHATRKNDIILKDLNGMQNLCFCLIYYFENT